MKVHGHRAVTLRNVVGTRKVPVMPSNAFVTVTRTIFIPILYLYTTLLYSNLYYTTVRSIFLS